MAWIEETLAEVLVNTLGLAPDEVSGDLSMDNCAAWDSLRHITLMLAVEGAFGVSFTEAEIGSLTSFTLLAQAVTARKGAD